MDLSKIQESFVLPNHYLGLRFPTQGYVFYRCEGVEVISYKYEEIGSIAADTQRDAARLGISADNIDNLLRVQDCDHVYQVYIGWKPGCIRQYLYYPYEQARRNLDVRNVYSKAPFGGIEGFDSPYDAPGPDTEIFIPKGVEVGFAWYNRAQAAKTLRLNLLIRKMRVDILRDADLIEKILKGQQRCRFATLGGVEASFEYDAPGVLDVGFVPLSATRAEIEQALA